MEKLVPIIIGIALGALIWRTTKGHLRGLLSVLAVLASGFAATVLSGEYHQSWLYLLLDLGEAAFGLTVGFAIAHWLLWSHRANAPPAASEHSPLNR
jgi:hypothetical protein